MKKLGLAAIVLSAGLAGSGCAVAVGAGLGAGAYKVLKDDKAEKASLESTMYPVGKITRVYTCGSEGTFCTEVYVDKRGGLAKSGKWYEDGYIYSGATKADGKLDRVCDMHGDSLDTSTCKLVEDMKVSRAKAEQTFFGSVKDAYSRQK